jgi:uncharacterized protein YjbI with pentapeptide repeats
MSAAELLASCARNGQRACDLDLHGASLACADLSRLRADGLDLRHADLHSARFVDAHLTSCRLDGARLEGSDWSGAIVRLCSLDSGRGPAARLVNTRLEDSIAEAADFTRANFHDAHLTDTSFSRAVLREAVLDGAEGDSIDFRGADLRSADLRGVRFDEADFRGADLRHANLSSGRFHSADFRGALLEGTNFEGADFAGATFDQREHPVKPAPAMEHEREAADAAARLLTDFLALLPAALSGAQPGETMKRLQELIGKAAESSGYSPEAQQAMRDFVSNLAKPGGFEIERLQQIIAALQSDSAEPPKEWKQWLEPLTKALEKRP